MAVLISLSALFSGSEAALFSLSARDQRRLGSAGSGGRIALSLLGNSEQLLSAILFWNLLINMLYFAIASIVAGDLESNESFGASWALGFTVLSLLAMIFMSEMLPKSLAVLAPLRTSIVIAPPLNLAFHIIKPLLPLIGTANLLSGRLLWPGFQAENEIDLADIERAVELGTDDAALIERERLAVSSLVELGTMRASELMRPRGKLRLFHPPGELAEIFQQETPGGYLIITDESLNHMVGSLDVRLLRPSQVDRYQDWIEPVIYVPWAASVARVLDQLTESDAHVAIVVDEYGDCIGALSTDRIFRRILAPHSYENVSGDTALAMKDMGDGSWQVSGSMPLRQLAKFLQEELADESIATVAGYLQRTNERLPRVGDQALLGGYQLSLLDQVENESTIEVRPLEDPDAGEMPSEMEVDQ